MSSSSLLSSLGAALHNLSSPRFSFRSSSPTARSSLNPSLSAFDSELASQLDELKSADDAGYLSSRWVCRAVGTVLSTYAFVEAFVPDLRQALADGETKWLDEYLEDSVKLLDVCTVMREAIADMKNYHVCVELALHILEKGSIGEAQLMRSKNALGKCTEALRRRDEDVNHLGQRRSKLESCSSMLRRMGEKLNQEDSTKGNFFAVLYAAQVTTIFICGVLTMALSLKPRRPWSSIWVAGQSPWAFSLSSLQQRVKEQVERKKAKGASALLEEMDKTDIAVRCLQERVEKLLNAKIFPLSAEQVGELRRALTSLRDCSTELSQGLDPMELHVGKVFKVLITSRMALLDIYSHL